MPDCEHDINRQQVRRTQAAQHTISQQDGAVTDRLTTTEDPGDFLVEMLGMARLQSEIGLRFVEAGDAIGVRYAVQRLTAYVRAAVETIDDLVTSAERNGGAR